MAEGGLLLAALAALGFVWPRLLAWPLAAFSLWLGLALLVRSARRRMNTPPGGTGRSRQMARPEATDEGAEAALWR
jgi:hypothetical protein